MSNLEASVWIDAPPRRVWTYVQDYGHRGEWDTRIAAAENLTGLPLSVGSRVRYRFHGVLGTGFWMEATYLAFRPGVRSTVSFRKMSALCPFAMAGGSWSFAPERGGTRFTTRFRYRLRWGWWGRLLDRWFTCDRARRETQRSLANLKTRIEAEQRVPVLVSI